MTERAETPLAKVAPPNRFFDALVPELLEIISDFLGASPFSRVGEAVYHAIAGRHLRVRLSWAKRPKDRIPPPGPALETLFRLWLQRIHTLNLEVPGREFGSDSHVSCLRKLRVLTDAPALQRLRLAVSWPPQTEMNFAVALCFIACLIAVLGAQASSPCKPILKTNAKVCEKKIAACALLGIEMKYSGVTCPKKGKSGCQCMNYCGYPCKKACNADKSCKWVPGSGCTFLSTGEVGGPVPICSTGAPSASPTTPKPTTKPSKSPTTTAPSKSPTTSAPSTSPTTSAPSTSPTTLPTHSPTTHSPTTSPTQSPTTSAPSSSPSHSPTQCTTLVGTDCCGSVCTDAYTCSCTVPPCHCVQNLN